MLSRMRRWMCRTRRHRRRHSRDVARALRELLEAGFCGEIEGGHTPGAKALFLPLAILPRLLPRLNRVLKSADRNKKRTSAAKAALKVRHFRHG
jgi:hypothetical protein